MKIPIYIKVAKASPKTKNGRKYLVSGSPVPNTTPLMKAGWEKNEYYPTVFFGIELEIPDSAFDYANKIMAKIDYRFEEVTQIDQKTQDAIQVTASKIMLKGLKK